MYNINNQGFTRHAFVHISLCFRCWERSHNGLTTESERRQNEGKPGSKRGKIGFRLLTDLKN